MNKERGRKRTKVSEEQDGAGELEEERREEETGRMKDSGVSHFLASQH